MEPDDDPGRDACRFGDVGASLVEYALLVALIALVCVSALVYFQSQVTSSFTRSASQIQAGT